MAGELLGCANQTSIAQRRASRSARSSALAFSLASACEMTVSAREWHFERLQESGLEAGVSVWDALSARIAQEQGFRWASISGGSVAASHLGLPDTGVITATEMASVTSQIAAAAPDIALIADADDGYGNVLNVQRTVRLLEDAGAAGCTIEDQDGAFPKTLGQPNVSLGYKGTWERIPAEKMVGKIKAALAARRDPHFVITARTDYNEGDDMAEIVRRGRLYADAGADVFFPNRMPTKEDLRRVCAEVAIPIRTVQNLDYPPPPMSLAELNEVGVKFVLFSQSAFLAAYRAAEATWRRLRESLQNQDGMPSLEFGTKEYEMLWDMLGRIEHERIVEEYS